MTWQLYERVGARKRWGTWANGKRLFRILRRLIMVRRRGGIHHTWDALNAGPTVVSCTDPTWRDLVGGHVRLLSLSVQLGQRRSYWTFFPTLHACTGCTMRHRTFKTPILFFSCIKYCFVLTLHGHKYKLLNIGCGVWYAQIHLVQARMNYGN